MCLLIVPYGIETCLVFFLLCHLSALLIVPYGIETGNPGSAEGRLYLLIVPYGIETDLLKAAKPVEVVF